MSGTEEASGTRPSPAASRWPRCPHCNAPLELEGQVQRRCTYCKKRIYQEETKHLVKIWHLFGDFMPYLIWVGFAVLVIKLMGVHYD